MRECEIRVRAKDCPDANDARDNVRWCWNYMIKDEIKKRRIRRTACVCVCVSYTNKQTHKNGECENFYNNFRRCMANKNYYWCVYGFDCVSHHRTHFRLISAVWSRCFTLARHELGVAREFFNWHLEPREKCTRPASEAQKPGEIPNSEMVKDRLADLQKVCEASHELPR